MKMVGILRLTFLLIASFVMSAQATAAKPACAEPEWDATCFRDSPTGKSLKPQFLKRVKFQRNGHAVLSVGPFRSVAINRKGKVVIPGIVSGDFDYTDAENGVAAFYTDEIPGRASQCGFFQISNFQVVIPPQYHICSRFVQGYAHVCRNCALDCGDCHNYEFYGEEGFIINNKNEIVRHLPLSKLPRCSTVKARGGFPKDQQCRPDDR